MKSVKESRNYIASWVILSLNYLKPTLTMSDVPSDLHKEILSRLPVISLLRFRCVSKTWLALINSLDFINLHLNQSIKNNSNITITYTNGQLYSVDSDLLDNPIELNHPIKGDDDTTQILGSCNGLLCLANIEEGKLVLWNPSTRKHVELPDTKTEWLRSSDFCGCVIYGFGYDHVNDDYKVVRVVQFVGKSGDLFCCDVKVYSLKLGLWRGIKDFPYYICYKGFRGAFAGGALHWVVCRNPKSDGEKLIGAFDLGKEGCRLVPLPEDLDKELHVNVGVLGESLCLFTNFSLREVDVWVMKSYGVKESWTKLFSISQPNDIKSFVYLRPVAYSKSGDRVLIEQDDGAGIWWYDLKKKKVDNVGVRDGAKFYETKVCLGSLVELNCSDGSHGTKEIPQKRFSLWLVRAPFFRFSLWLVRLFR